MMRKWMTDAVLRGVHDQIALLPDSAAGDTAILVVYDEAEGVRVEALIASEMRNSPSFVGAHPRLRWLVEHEPEGVRVLVVGPDASMEWCRLRAVDPDARTIETRGEFGFLVGGRS